MMKVLQNYIQKYEFPPKSEANINKRKLSNSAKTK